MNCEHYQCPGEIINDAFLLHSDYTSMAPSKLFRRAIRHQMNALHRHLETQLGIKEFSLDHHPVPFIILKRIFLMQQGINPDTLTRDQITLELMFEWQQFHGQVAEYRIIDREFNGWFGKKIFDYWLTY